MFVKASKYRLPDTSSCAPMIILRKTRTQHRGVVEEKKGWNGWLLSLTGITFSPNLRAYQLHCSALLPHLLHCLVQLLFYLTLRTVSRWLDKYCYITNGHGLIRGEFQHLFRDWRKPWKNCSLDSWWSMGYVLNPTWSPGSVSLSPPSMASQIMAQCEYVLQFRSAKQFQQFKRAIRYTVLVTLEYSHNSRRT
jgi:hypothetical protein